MAPIYTEPLTDPKVAAGAAAWWVFGALSSLAVSAIAGYLAVIRFAIL